MTTETETVKVSFVPKAKLGNSISILARDAGRLQYRIHNIAVSILRVWHDEGEPFAQEATEYLNNLMEASPYHTKAVSVWIGKNTNLSFSEDNSRFYIDPAKEGSSVVYDRQFKAGRDVPFWKLSPPSKAQPFDLNAEIVKLLERARKHAAKPREGDVVPMDKLRALSDLSQAVAA